MYKINSTNNNVHIHFSSAKLIGMGSDGAANMVGGKSGLVTLLRQNITDELLNIHCLCHRLELSFRDAFKKVKLYDKLMTTLLKVANLKFG